MLSLLLKKKNLTELARKKDTHDQIIYILEKSGEISKELLYARSSIADQPISYKIGLLDFVFPFVRILFPQQKIDKDVLIRKIKQKGGYLEKVVLGTNELLKDLHKESLFTEHNELKKTRKDNFSTPCTLWERILYFFGRRTFPFVDASNAHLDRIVEKATQHIVNVYQENTLTILDKHELADLKKKLKDANKPITTRKENELLQQLAHKKITKHAFQQAYQDAHQPLTAHATNEILQTFYKKIFYKGLKQKIDHLEKIVTDTLPPETPTTKQTHEVWHGMIKQLSDAIFDESNPYEPKFTGGSNIGEVIKDFYTKLLATPSTNQQLGTAEDALRKSKNDISVAFMSVLFLKPSTFICAPALLESIIDLDLASSICQGLKDHNASDQAMHQWIAGYETLELKKHPRANAQEQDKLKKTAHAHCLRDIFELLSAYAPTLKKSIAIETANIEKYYLQHKKLDHNINKEITDTKDALRNAPYKTEQALCQCLHAIMHKPENIIPTIIALRKQTVLPDLFEELNKREAALRSRDSIARQKAEAPSPLHDSPACKTIWQQCFPILQISQNKKKQPVIARLASVTTDVTQKQLTQTFQNKLLRPDVIKEKILFIQDRESRGPIAKLKMDTFTPDETIKAFWEDPNKIAKDACTEGQFETLDNEIQRYTAAVLQKNTKQGIDLQEELNKIPLPAYIQKANIIRKFVREEMDGHVQSQLVQQIPKGDLRDHLSESGNRLQVLLPAVRINQVEQDIESCLNALANAYPTHHSELLQRLRTIAPPTTDARTLLNGMHLNSLLGSILQKPTEVFSNQSTSNPPVELSDYKQTPLANTPTFASQETQQMLTLIKAITQLFSIKEDKQLSKNTPSYGEQVSYSNSWFEKASSAVRPYGEQLSYSKSWFEKACSAVRVGIQCYSILPTPDSQTSPSWRSKVNPLKKLNNLVEKLTHYAKDPIKLAQLLEHPQTLMSCIQNLSFSESKDGWFRNLIRPGLFSLLFIPTKNTPENNVHADQTFESLKPIICALIAETQTPEKRHALAQIISNMVSIATTTDATANTEANTDTNNVGARIKQYLMSKEGLENLSHLIPTLLKIAPTIQDFLNNKYTSHFKNSLLLKILVALSPETQQSAFKLSDKQKKQLSAESYQALYGKKSASNNEKGLELYELVERIMDPKNDNDKTDSEEMAHLKEQRSDFEQLTAASKGLLCFLPFFFEKYNTYHYALMPALMQDKTTIVLDQAQQSKLQTLHPTAYNVYQALHSDDTETLNTLLQPLDDQSKHSVYDSLFSCLNHTQKDVLLQKSWQDTLQKFSTHIQAFEKTTVYDITTPLQGLVQLLQSVKYTQTPTIHNPANDVQQLNHLAPLLLFLLKPMLKQYGIDINNQTACAIAENLTKEVLKNVVLQHQTPKTIDGLPQKKHRFLFTRSLSSLFFKNPIAKFFDWLISAFIILPLEGLKAYFHTQRHSPKPATHRTRPHHSNTMPLPKAQTPGTGVKQTQHAHPNAPEATPQIPKAKN